MSNAEEHVTGVKRGKLATISKCWKTRIKFQSLGKMHLLSSVAEHASGVTRGKASHWMDEIKLE